ncbi:hypothetical protein OIU78_028215 [Salix suchowensis]|nr:hypothetical protein OIU78_028215 [Salix suchowensis]
MRVFSVYCPGDGCVWLTSQPNSHYKAAALPGRTQKQIDGKGSAMKLVGSWWRVKSLILSRVSGSAGNLQFRKSKRKTQAAKQNRLKPYDNASVLLPLREDW